MISLYLDQNLIIDLRHARKPELSRHIDALDRRAFQIYFSPAHIEEIAALEMHHGQPQEVAPMLELLSSVSRSNALLPFPRRNVAQVQHRGIYASIESPAATYARVVKDYTVNAYAEDHQREKLQKGVEFGERHGVTARDTNNIDIAKELDIFAPELTALVAAIHRQLLDGPLADHLPARAPSRSQLSFDHLARYFPLHELVMEKMFEFLELRRFHPDKPSQYLSGLHDTTHAIYGAYCDVFVSNDAGLRSKAKAVYSWLGVKSKVLGVTEFIEYLDGSRPRARTHRHP